MSLPTDATCTGEVVVVLALETTGFGPGMAVIEPDIMIKYKNRL